MTPLVGGSNASARPSVTAVIRLTQRICTGVTGRVSPMAIAAITVRPSPPFVGKM